MGRLFHRMGTSRKIGASASPQILVAPPVAMMTMTMTDRGDSEEESELND